MKNIQNELSLIDRLAAPTPGIFKTIGTIGICLAALGGTLMGIQEQGIELPAFLTVLANVATVVAGLVAKAVSSLTVDLEKYKKQNALN